MQRERRRDPYRWTWEPAAAAVIVAVFVLIIGIQLGRSLANLLAGAGWTWPATDTGSGFDSPLGAAFWSSLRRVLAGQAAAGLPTPIPGDLAGPQLLWTSIVLTEVTLLAAVTWVGTYVYLRWGPGRMRGMATVSQAEKLLGVTRLRKVSALVRPDLYGKHARMPAPVHRDAGSTDEPHNIELGRGLSPWLLPGRTRNEG